jgi:DNA-cytosine methyltransferase
MKVLSLFSGVGGFDMGLENAGMQTVFQCEWDKHCRTILDRHWPTVPKWDDVSTLTGEHILAHAPVIDVVAWGSPCQDLSVAGKRAGLEGGRSGLFYEGIRIINELRKASNGRYPRISIWENVYGALNSNKGEDFEAILKEMVEAGSLLCEWRVLDAQYFGVPQRRRRVFVVAVFDSATAARCPDPLLPVSEGLRWHPTTRATTREEPADTTSASIGSGSQWWDGGQIANALTTTSNEQRMPDKDRLQAVVIEPFTPSSFAQYEQGVGTLRSNGGDLGGGSETVMVETFTKSRRAQSATDDETWVEGKPAPTLNSFDQGDVRATTVIVNEDRTYRDVTGALLGRDSFGPNHEGARDGKLILEPMLIDGRRVDDVRVYESPVQTLQARMGTGGNNTPMLMFDTQFGSNANVFENQSPTLKASQAAPSVAYNEVVGTLRSGGDGGVPSSRGEHLVVEPNVAIPIDTRNALRNPDKYDAQNRQGLGIGADGDPMATLTSAHVNGVAAGSATMVVRRLTPLECERLMGWPDDHTRYKADGTEQADTHRYKQCGNGVASPVAEWIGEQLRNL